MASRAQTHGIGIQVTVDGRQADLMLAAIEAALVGGSLARYLRENMIPWMRKRAAMRFAAEGDDAVGQWAPLAEVTQDIRERLGVGREHPINRRTGELEAFMLRGAFDQTTQPMAASVFYPSRMSGRLGNKVKVAQQGQEAGPRVPARPVVGASMTDMNYFVNNFSFWFAREVQQRFRGGGS